LAERTFDCENLLFKQEINNLSVQIEKQELVVLERNRIADASAQKLTEGAIAFAANWVREAAKEIVEDHAHRTREAPKKDTLEALKLRVEQIVAVLPAEMKTALSGSTVWPHKNPDPIDSHFDRRIYDPARSAMSANLGRVFLEAGLLRNNRKWTDRDEHGQPIYSTGIDWPKPDWEQYKEDVESLRDAEEELEGIRRTEAKQKAGSMWDAL